MGNWARLLFLLVVVVGSTVCESAESSARTNLVIGLLLPANEPYGQSIQQGVLLGIERASRAEKVAASAIIRGAAGQWGTDGVEAARMVTEDGSEALIAPTGGSATHLVLQVAGRTGVPVLSLCGDSSVTQTGVRWMARVAPGTKQEARELFLHLKASAKQSPKRWLALVPPARAGREITRDLSEAGSELGIGDLKALEVRWPLADPRSFLRQVMTNHAEAILVWLEPVVAGTVANQLRASGFRGVLAGPGRLSCREFVDSAGPASRQFFVPVPIPGASEGCYREFSDAYRARFGSSPDFTAAMGYDAARLLVHLLKATREGSAHEAFPITSEFLGATGRLSFDTLGNRNVALAVTQVGPAPFEPVQPGTEALGNQRDFSRLRAKAGEPTPHSEVR